MSSFSNIQSLLDIMARLRDPETGCPWDVQQEFATISPYTIEEAYEVDDAIRRENYAELKEELGDLLLQVVFHSRIAEEKKMFGFGEVCSVICEKMIARHPHVFAENGAWKQAEEVKISWEDIKQKERANKRQHSILDGVALALPAVMRAQKLQKRAARIGFDWPTHEEILDKIDEELQELLEARESGDAGHTKEEFGDLLFAVVNLGRKLDVDAEAALREANAKFERRFRGLESKINPEDDADLAYLENLWNEEKLEERASKKK